MLYEVVAVKALSLKTKKHWSGFGKAHCVEFSVGNYNSWVGHTFTDMDRLKYLYSDGN